MDLFSYQPTPSYPNAAGFKDRTTSKEAAVAIEASGKAETEREAVLAWYRAGNTGTADQAIAALGLTPVLSRPRVSELYKQGLLMRLPGHHATGIGGGRANVLGARS